MKQTPWVPCEICGEPTFYLQTQLCSTCWQINRMIPKDLDEQKKLLTKINKYRVEGKGDV